MNKDTKISSHILTDISLYKTYLNQAYICLIFEKKILFFLPFIILIFNRKFITFIQEYKLYFLYILVPVFVSIFLYSLVGNNFFRVYYQGFFVFIIFALIFLSKNIETQKFLPVLYFFLPSTFAIDFIFILFNINQLSFSDYYNFVRYEYLSGYFIFSLLFIFIFFKLRSKTYE